MNLKELFAKHGVDSAELLTEVEKIIEESSKISDNMIPYDRFKEVVKQRNEIKAKLAENETQMGSYKENIENLKAKVTELTGYRSKYENHIKTVNEEKLNKWNKLKKTFVVSKEDPNYDKFSKVYSKFKLEDEITIDDVENNLKMYETYAEIGYFGNNDKPFENDKTPGTPPENKEYKSPFDAFD